MNWFDITKFQSVLRGTRLNIGSAKSYHGKDAMFRGWVGVDKAKRPGYMIQHHLPNPIPLPNDSVDAAMSEHFVEHLTDVDAGLLFTEVHRLLVSGGWFRVAVPDVLHPKHERNRIAGRDLDIAGHLSCWDCGKLENHLRMAGFAVIELMHWWTSDGVYHERITDNKRGYIRRCPEHDPRNLQKRKYGRLWSTSLTMDVQK